MPRRPSWYDHNNPSKFLAALWKVRHFCTSAEATLPHTKQPGSMMLVDAIKSAIDDWAEHEMGARDYFWGMPHSAGCKHS
jgi:hypothetical protein